MNDNTPTCSYVPIVPPTVRKNKFVVDCDDLLSQELIDMLEDFYGYALTKRQMRIAYQQYKTGRRTWYLSKPPQDRQVPSWIQPKRLFDDDDDDDMEPMTEYDWSDDEYIASMAIGDDGLPLMDYAQIARWKLTLAEGFDPVCLGFRTKGEFIVRGPDVHMPTEMATFYDRLVDCPPLPVCDEYPQTLESVSYADIDMANNPNDYA